ncbi:DUF3168 domain-containing protein [Litorivita pollutaquae]|uniref:DUF3168 domain-containing protein n=1 Tax=Litorivita pollutaquae TaxID=2200892 RepID=A0A2V4N482_9RHOB|nr:DUF3168 domain-containing protein [Litorivita pollutaquae]OUS20846.1 hypothetical protein A9Q95_11345 [Rhodobacterales bacterium 59_46_T64]PYC48712.1 DUF3168 domain-containing protein [Litorivita pollutaquae]
MSYVTSPALQAAVFSALSADPTVTGLVSGAIYDALPSGTLPSTYVSLGPETVFGASDMTSEGALHKFEVSVVTTDQGFQSAKDVGAAICDVLIDADLTLSRGTLIGIGFDRAVALREENGTVRRINLTFRARVEA